MLQHAPVAASLGAADQLAPRDTELVDRGHRKAVEIHASLLPLGCGLGRVGDPLGQHPDLTQRSGNGIGEPGVGRPQPGGQERFRGRHRVGEIGAVKHGPTARRAVHHADTRVATARFEPRVGPLRVPERQPGSAPSVESQGGLAGGDRGGEDGLVDAHVERTRRVAVIEQSPDPGQRVSARGDRGARADRASSSSGQSR